MLERVAVTVVSAKNEDYAFDMFESLNTTGEALTAFETFKPKVIEAETLQHYEKSPSRKSLLEVEGYLDNFQGAQSKHNATSSLLIPFALSETGFKLSKRLSDQRSFLRDNFDKLDSLEKKRSFVKHLEHNSIFTRNIWNRGQDYSNENEFPNFKDKQPVELALKVLKDIKHEISLAILVRFFSCYRLAVGQKAEQALFELQEAIKACLAFFALWRGSRKDTDNIDSHYRNIMQEGIPEINVPAFCRKMASDSSEVISSKKLKEAFRYILRNHGEINNKAQWVKKASIQAIYKAHGLCKFMLFAATHDTQPDSSGLGFTQKSKKNTLNILNKEMWGNDWTIEHVCPQKRMSDGWDYAIYDNAELVDYLGNLTLVPAIPNAVLSNKTWDEKRFIYRILSSPNLDSLKENLDEINNSEGKFTYFYNLTDNGESIINSAPFLPQLKTICEIQGNWSPEVIKKRSENMAENIWDRIVPWLDWD